MKFVSLTTTVISALGLAGIAAAAASSPLGGPCVYKDQYECGYEPDYNNGYVYAFYCTSANIIANVQNCDCLECCGIDEHGVASCLPVARVSLLPSTCIIMA
ncbi:hypothetical protein K503DRAFT_471449 [Rhizopogon vinicolor AM-OR11-026]|uniref:Uncharacterized protein n=1 Tax=Rhizopogon vinicolor AM-OR11-026 TaxID=1314800 RepID=A0A1B7N9Y9_9AGAM|nr:hypothetical protein K503DRAFT_471449 [Rhizopogon vinicolor AM-OR11-026]